MPDGRALAVSARPIRDPRDPSLRFSAKVLGPQGFERSAWTGRYVDPDTEADFVAFLHRRREVGMDTWCVFIDIVKAYDSVDRELLALV